MNPARLSQTAGRVLLPVLAAIFFVASLVTLGPVVYRPDSGSAVANVAELRSLLFDVGAAADASRISGDRTSLDQALMALQLHWESIQEPVGRFLGAEMGPSSRADLDQKINAFIEDAVGYAEGTTDGATASATFDAAVSGADDLTVFLGDRSNVRSDNLRAIEVGGSLLLLAAAVTAAFGVRLWRRDWQSKIQHDATTGLPDRSAFLLRLGAAIKRSPSGSSSATVLFINLDRFTLFNESLGHRGGDALLVAVAKRLSETLPWDHALARFGGDEFLVLIPAESKVSAEDGISIIRRAFGPPFVVEGEPLHVAASIGASAVRADRDPEQLVREAQVAMQHSRRTGGGQVEQLDGAHSPEGPDRLRLEAELRQALELDQFSLHYQPLFRASDGEIEAFEALLRWEHPERGLVGPDGFIPVLEQSGLIIEVGARVLEAACIQTAMWAEAGLGQYRVAVNVSAHQLLVPGFVDTVRDALSESGLKPALLELEITETTAMEQVEFVAEVLDELNWLGVRLALDDFGQGYSSLARLQRLPMSTVKIDRDFIPGIATSPARRSVVAGIIGLSHALGLTVVAEGVEENQELQVLQELGCDLIQGFLLSRPLSPSAVEAILLERVRTPILLHQSNAPITAGPTPIEGAAVPPPADHTARAS